MTDDEKRELIADMRAYASNGTDSVYAPAEMLRVAADALEGTLAEPEWEYRIRSYYVPNKVTAYGAVMDQETAEVIMSWRDQGIERTLQKRVAPGPWEVVPDV